ncbi:MAG TPA: hypothetical protein VFU76_14705 [Terriglobales bacterium]|nr:hypothetical protein [Terriglobales bacterium]
MEWLATTLVLFLVLAAVGFVLWFVLSTMKNPEPAEPDDSADMREPVPQRPASGAEGIALDEPDDDDGTIS